MSFDYFSPTDFVDVEERITALAPIGDSVAVFTAARIGIYSPIDEIGQFQWTRSPVGATNPRIEVTDTGILFARPEGLWLFDGLTATKLSEQIEDDWISMHGNWDIAATPSYILCSNFNGAVLASMSGGTWKWSLLSSSYPEFVTRSPDARTVYGQVSGDIYTMFSGANKTLTIRTKDFGGWKTYEGVEVWADIDAGGNNFSVVMQTNHGVSKTLSVTGKSSRFRYRIRLPKTVRGEYISMKVVGDVTVYGLEEVLL